MTKITKPTQPFGLTSLTFAKALALASGLAAGAGHATAQVAVETGIRAERAVFVAVGQHGANGPESFVVPVDGAARIAEVRQYLADRAAGRETRPLIPTVMLRLGADGENRNHSAPAAPVWDWHVAEVVGFARYVWPEVEPAVYIASRDSSPSDLAALLRGRLPGLPDHTVALRRFPIVMELKSEFPGSRLANVSDRGFVGPGHASKITGFVVEGGEPRSVVVRVLGPSLAAFGVTGALANPRLEVYRGSEKIAENDDWAQGNLNRPHIAVVPPPAPFHLLPHDAREPALELSLPPGAYTVVVTGVGDTSGIVLTEVHTL